MKETLKKIALAPFKALGWILIEPHRLSYTLFWILVVSSFVVSNVVATILLAGATVFFLLGNTQEVGYEVRKLRSIIVEEQILRYVRSTTTQGPRKEK